jgi:hypothetical protein
MHSTVQVTLKDTCNKDVRLVPYAKWLEAVRASSDKGNDSDVMALAANPITKLLDYFDSIAEGEALQSRLNQKKTLHASEFLRSLEVLQIQWIRGWKAE